MRFCNPGEAICTVLLPLGLTARAIESSVSGLPAAPALLALSAQLRLFRGVLPAFVPVPVCLEHLRLSHRCRNFFWPGPTVGSKFVSALWSLRRQDIQACSGLRVLPIASSDHSVPSPGQPGCRPPFAMPAKY